MVESPTGYGTDDLACDANNAGDADDMGEAYDAIDSSDLPEGTAAAKVAALASAQLEPASKRAVISLDSPATDAEQQFRMAIVTLDGIPYVKVKRESKTLATITFQNFFNKFEKIGRASCRERV